MESGINAALTVASSKKSQQNALYGAEIRLITVQNAENVGASEGKTRSIRGFYSPKKNFYGCDGSSWVYAGWHCDDITDTVVIIT